MHHYAMEQNRRLRDELIASRYHVHVRLRAWKYMGAYTCKHEYVRGNRTRVRLRYSI